MRDVILVSIILIVATYGFLLPKLQKGILRNQIIHLVSVLIAVVLVSILFNLSTPYIVYLALSLPIGFILSFFHPALFFNLAAIAFSGAYCVSSHSNPYTMWICLMAFFLAGFGLKQVIKPTNTLAYLAQFSAGLLIYNLLFVLTVKSLFINGLLLSLMAFVLGSTLNKKHLLMASIPYIPLTYFFPLWSFLICLFNTELNIYQITN